jgi:iduronate 2-sulfatase
VALCAPTRFSLLTGLRPDSTGVYLNPDQPQDLLRMRLPEVVTLPQHFKNHDYITHPLHKVFDGRTVDPGHDAVSWTVPYGPWEMTIKLPFMIIQWPGKVHRYGYRPGVSGA